MKPRFSLRTLLVIVTLICVTITLCLSKKTTQGKDGYDWQRSEYHLSLPYVGPIVRVNIQTYTGGTIAKAGRDKIVDVECILWDTHFSKGFEYMRK